MVAVVVVALVVAVAVTHIIAAFVALAVVVANYLFLSMPVLLLRAEAHDRLHHGAVVPASIEENDLSGVRKVLDVALHVQLGALGCGRLTQSHHPVSLLVHVAGHSTEGAALA